MTRLGRERAQYLRAANLDVGRRLRAEKDVDGVGLGEVLPVDRKHFGRMRMRLSKDSPRLNAVRLGRLSSTVGRKVFDDAWEGSHRLRGYRERPSLNRVLVVEENRRDVEIISDLIYKKFSLEPNSTRPRDL